MHPRTWGVPEILPLDKKLVRSGDTIDILRLDGLDPMIAWAMGAATGHTAVALWKDELVRSIKRFVIYSRGGDPAPVCF